MLTTPTPGEAQHWGPYQVMKNLRSLVIWPPGPEGKCHCEPLTISDWHWNHLPRKSPTLCHSELLIRRGGSPMCRARPWAQPHVCIQCAGLTQQEAGNTSPVASTIPEKKWHRIKYLWMRKLYQKSKSTPILLAYEMSRRFHQHPGRQWREPWTIPRQHSPLFSQGQQNRGEEKTCEKTQQ